MVQSPRHAFSARAGAKATEASLFLHYAVPCAQESATENCAGLQATFPESDSTRAHGKLGTLMASTVSEMPNNDATVLNFALGLGAQFVDAPRGWAVYLKHKRNWPHSALQAQIARLDQDFFPASTTPRFPRGAQGKR